MKLGVLGRTVIVASCFWMLGGTFFIAKDINDKATAAADRFYKVCTSVPKDEGGDCAAQWATRLDDFRGLWGSAVLDAAIILALALILLAAVYWSVRWILAGRQSKVRS